MRISSNYLNVLLLDNVPCHVMQLPNIKTFQQKVDELVNDESTIDLPSKGEGILPNVTVTDMHKIKKGSRKHKRTNGDIELKQ